MAGEIRNPVIKSVILIFIPIINAKISIVSYKIMRRLALCTTIFRIAIFTVLYIGVTRKIRNTIIFGIIFTIIRNAETPCPICT